MKSNEINTEAGIASKNIMKPNEVYFRIVPKSSVAIQPEFLSETYCTGKLETIQAYQALADLLKEFNKDFFKYKLLKSKSGKPYFKNARFKFNYSHSRNFVAVAVSKHEIGIDIEELDHEVSDAVAKKFLNDEKDHGKRLEFWVRKEAYSKLVGKGLQAHFSAIDFSQINSPEKNIKTDEFFCAIFANEKAKFIQK